MKKVSLDLRILRAAVAGGAIALRRQVRLQPAGGPGTKVFPPTASGGAYTLESRRIGDSVVPCVVLDSPQSQANRMEAALLRLLETDSRVTFPHVELDTTTLPGWSGRRITCLNAPHRLADAIFRDSLLNGAPFRQSAPGRELKQAGTHNATPVLRLSAPSLVFGAWDSHYKDGSFKFSRTVVSEIYGVDAVCGLRAAGRIDPLGITKDNTGFVKHPNGEVDLVAVGTKGSLRPSEVGHGNIAPSFRKYTESVDVPDPFRPGQMARKGAIAPDGVTFDYAIQTTLLEIAAFRQIHFLVDQEHDPEAKKRDPDAELAARTALASLALAAIVLMAGDETRLRQQCLLAPESEPEWVLIGSDGKHVHVDIDRERAIAMLIEAGAECRDAGLPWPETPVHLTPSPVLVELLKRQMEAAA